MTYIVIASLITLTFVLTFGLLLPNMDQDARPAFGVFLFLWIFAHIFFQIGAYWQRDDFKFHQSLPPPASEKSVIPASPP
jgi:predicted Na+-dependent transporter